MNIISSQEQEQKQDNSIIDVSNRIKEKDNILQEQYYLKYDGNDNNVKKIKFKDNVDNELYFSLNSAIIAFIDGYVYSIINSYDCKHFNKYYLATQYVNINMVHDRGKELTPKYLMDWKTNFDIYNASNRENKSGYYNFNTPDMLIKHFNSFKIININDLDKNNLLKNYYNRCILFDKHQISDINICGIDNGLKCGDGVVLDSNYFVNIYNIAINYVIQEILLNKKIFIEIV